MVRHIQNFTQSSFGDSCWKEEEGPRDNEGGVRQRLPSLVSWALFEVLFTLNPDQLRPRSRPRYLKESRSA